MKEATGELSTTVIAIVAIAAILAVFTVFLLPTLRAQIALSQACSNGPGYSTNHENGSEAIKCDGSPGATQWNCTFKDDKGTNMGTKTCAKSGS